MTRWFLIALLAFAAACKGLITSSREEPHQIFEELSLSQTYSGRHVWDLRAQTGILKEEAQQTHLVLPQIEMYKNDKVVTRVKSSAGLIYMESHDIRLSSSVVVISLEDNSVLKTEQLDYVASRQKFVTDKAVELTRPDGVMLGQGMEADSSLSDIRIFNQKSKISTRE